MEDTELREKSINTELWKTILDEWENDEKILFTDKIKVAIYEFNKKLKNDIRLIQEDGSKLKELKFTARSEKDGIISNYNFEWDFGEGIQVEGKKILIEKMLTLARNINRLIIRNEYIPHVEYFSNGWYRLKDVTWAWGNDGSTESFKDILESFNILLAEFEKGEMPNALQSMVVFNNETYFRDGSIEEFLELKELINLFLNKNQRIFVREGDDLFNLIWDFSISLARVLGYSKCNEKDMEKIKSLRRYLFSH